MQYNAKPRTSSRVYETVRESVGASTVLCLPVFWADWHHRGRLSSEDTTCYFVGIDAEKFCLTATRNGGPLWQFLQIFGILLVGHIEGLDEEETLVTDLSLPEEEYGNLTERAELFAATVRRNSDIASKVSALNPLRTISRPNFSRGPTTSRSSLSLGEKKDEIVDCRV